MSLKETVGNMELHLSALSMNVELLPGLWLGHIELFIVALRQGVGV